MKLAFITPIKYIKDYGNQGDFTLALSHMINKEEETDYEKALKNAKKPIWLDNGAFEKGIPDGIDNLFLKAKKIKAELVFAPDFWNDSKKTLEGLNNFLYIRKKLNLENIKVGAILQAEDFDSFIQLYKTFQEIPEIDIIGINYLTTSIIWQKKKVLYKKELKNFIHDESRITKDRIEFLKYLKENFKNNKKIHLLGLGNSYEDVLWSIKNFPEVYSNDTSAPFWGATKNKKILKDGSIEEGKSKDKLNFNFIATKKQLDLAQFNIKKIKNLKKEAKNVLLSV